MVAEASPARVDPPARLPLPDALRGVAAVLVALHHFGSELPLPGPLAAVARWGWIGVDVFFVLSGFVIAMLLMRGSVRPVGFLARRLARLMPPYLVTCALVVALGWASTLSPAYRGSPWSPPGIESIACHVSYACDLSGIAWNNPVLWSLAVEVQFYGIAACCAVAIAGRGAWLRTGAAVLLVAVALALGDAWWQRYLPEFALGFAAALWREPTVARGLRLAVAALVLAWAAALLAPPVALVAGAVAAAIATGAGRPMPRALLALGAVSYSMYLVHVPIGGRVVNLLNRLDPGPAGAVAILAAALVASLCAAWVMWRLVERPAIDLSRTIPDRARAGGFVMRVAST